MKISVLLLIFSLVASSASTSFVSADTGSYVSTVNNDFEEIKFTALMNDFRKENGLTPIQISKRLNAVARWMVGDMIEVNDISHTDSYGRDPFQRMAALGYTGSMASGENLCAGTQTSTAEVAFKQWKNSPHHLENMLETRYKFMGIARGYGETTEYGWYWANEFGSVE